MSTYFSTRQETFQLTNEQREYLGLEPIEKQWEKVILKGDKNHPDSLIYFDKNVLKRYIVSTEEQYSESHFNESTNERNTLLPKTSKGKEKKLTPSVLEQRQPIGVYFHTNNYGDLIIGNYSTQTMFYSNSWENSRFNRSRSISQIVQDFIKQSPNSHLEEIREFKNAKRKNIKFKSGDYFCFKLNRNTYGFGRVLLDIYKIRKKKLISHEHGFNFIMATPVLVQYFAYKSDKKQIDISLLDNCAKLPSDIMMDNLLLYGEFEIIGHRELKEEEFEFPISYGKRIDQGQTVFLQWGLIHKELPLQKFNKFTIGDNPFVDEDSFSRKVHNPFGYYSIGFRPRYDTNDILNTIANHGVYNYELSQDFGTEFDLRNPKHQSIKEEIFKAFNLDPLKSYIENCKLIGIEQVKELLKML